ncbi:hypothetical protein CLU79DRAFT_751145 [Phycomyces nitens]|nr:hypothetical protein CLU79DRAFT_751145 [Phycomyces nitens]
MSTYSEMNPLYNHHLGRVNKHTKGFVGQNRTIPPPLSHGSPIYPMSPAIGSQEKHKPSTHFIPQTTITRPSIPLRSPPYLSPPALSNSLSNSTWLIFKDEKWVPFDVPNQAKLEHTLSLGGTFVDITDSNFPNVKRVRVFPKSSYLSYLGVKYRLSRIMQPDAWLDHANLQRDNLEDKQKGISDTDPKLWEIIHSFGSPLATL